MTRFERFAPIYSRLVRGDAWKLAVIDWAVDQLQSGVDSPKLQVLAGLSPKEHRTEVEEYFEATLRELGEKPLGELETRLGQARGLAMALLDGELAPIETARRIHEVIVGPLNHPPSLQPWCDLDGGFVTEEGDKVRRLEGAVLEDRIRSYASAFLSLDPDTQLKKLREETEAPVPESEI